MTSVDAFLQWCESHKAVLPQLHALDLAHDAIYELQRTGLVLSEELDEAQTKVIRLEKQLGALQKDLLKADNRWRRESRGDA